MLASSPSSRDELRLLRGVRAYSGLEQAGDDMINHDIWPNDE